MATRTLNVVIAGDSKGMSKAVSSSTRELDRLDKSGRKTLGALKTGFLTLGTAAGVGAVAGLTASAKAAADSEVSMAKLKVMVENAGFSWKAHEKQIQRVIDKHSQLSGFDDEALGESFGNLLRTTGDINEAFKLNALTMDIARTKGIELSGAQSLLARVYNGAFNGVKRLGVAVVPVTKAQDALKASTDTVTDAQKRAAKEADATATRQQVLADLQQKFGGQAEAYGKTTAGAADRSKVAFENLGESIGANVTPIIARVAEGFTTLVRQMTLGEGPGGRIRDVFEGIAGTAASAFGGVRNLVTGFREGNEGARALAAGLGALAGAFVVFKTLSTAVAGVNALKAAWSGLSGAILRNPIGLVAVGIGALAAAFGILSIKTRDNTTDSRAFNDALRAQADALREVRDIDIDVAQRKANVKSATVGVEQAEKRLHDLRKSGKASALDLKQAEADLAQAKVSERRANRELARSEEDSTRKKQDAKTATRDLTDEEHKLNSGIDAQIDQHRRNIRALDDAIETQKRYGGNTKATRDNVEALRKKQQQLRNEINSLKSKKVDVSVRFKLTPAPGSSYGSGGIGDGIGQSVRGSVQKLAQSAADSGALGFGIPDIGGFGAGLHGANPGMRPVAAYGARFGLHVTSGRDDHSPFTSTGNLSWHGTGEALDLSDGVATPHELAFARFMATNFGGRLAELIHTPLGFSIKNGRRVSPIAASDHYDHVHVAVDLGRPGLGVGDGNGRRARTGDGPGDAAAAAYRYGGIHGRRNLIDLVAIAGRESRWRAGAVNINAATGDHSIGPWQINQLAHHGRFGTDAQLKNWRMNARAMGILFRSAGLRPWHGLVGTGPFMGRARTAVTRFLSGTSGGGGGHQGAGNTDLGSGGSTTGVGNLASGFGDTHAGGSSGALYGPGGPLGYEGQLARAGVAESTARAHDNVKGLVAALVQERKIKRRRLKRINKMLRHRLTKATRTRLLQEKAQLVDEIGDLSDSIKEYRADIGGGATTITQAEKLDAGVDPNKEPLLPPAPDSGDADAAIRELTAAIRAQLDFAQKVQSTENFQLKKYLADVIGGQIVGYGVVGRSHTPGTGTEYVYAPSVL